MAPNVFPRRPFNAVTAWEIGICDHGLRRISDAKRELEFLRNVLGMDCATYLAIIKRSNLPEMEATWFPKAWGCK